MSLTIEELPMPQITECSLCQRDGTWVMETVFDNGYFFRSTLPDGLVEKLLTGVTVDAEFNLDR